MLVKITSWEVYLIKIDVVDILGQYVWEGVHDVKISSWYFLFLKLSIVANYLLFAPTVNWAGSKSLVRRRKCQK
jgi:hypothetical protein